MCGDTELKESLRRSLDQYQGIKEIFGASLNNRMERDCWLENILVQVLLRQNDLSALEDIIRTAKSALTNFKTFINKLPQGKEKDFDEQMLDWYTELRAIKVLREKDFTKITSVPEAESKTIEFEAEIGTERALIEVKRKREPAETRIVEYLRTKLSAEQLKCPSTYKHPIGIESNLLYPRAELKQKDEPPEKLEEKENVLRQEIEDIVPRITECLREGDFSKLPKTQHIEVLQRGKPSLPAQPIQESVTEITPEIKIVICTSKQGFYISAGPPEAFSLGEVNLEGFEKSIGQTVEKAKNQLKEYGLGRHGRKFILVFVDLKPGLSFSFLADKKSVKKTQKTMKENLKGVKYLKILPDGQNKIIFLELND